MDGDRFDQFTRAITRDTSRRGFLKKLGAGIAGILGASAAVEETQAGPKKCKYQGSNCKGNADCCSLTCCNRVCCGDGQVCCNGQCVRACPSGQALDGACTCQSTTPACTSAAQCPQSSDPCRAAVCVSGQCGFADLNGFACDDGNPCTTGYDLPERDLRRRHGGLLRRRQPLHGGYLQPRQRLRPHAALERPLRQRRHLPERDLYRRRSVRGHRLRRRQPLYDRRLFERNMHPHGGGGRDRLHGGRCWRDRATPTARASPSSASREAAGPATPARPAPPAWASAGREPRPAAPTGAATAPAPAK